MTLSPKKFKRKPLLKSKSIIKYSRKNGRPWLVRVIYRLVFSIYVFSTEASRIEARISEGEAKRSKRDNLEYLLAKKITSVHYPMQELELNYPTTKGKVYSEEEDRYLLCRLWHYGMHMDDAYERIKKDITEFPVFRFDWFFKSRSPQELQRRCNTLLGMIEKEEELRQSEEAKSKPKGKVRGFFFFFRNGAGRLKCFFYRNVLLMKLRRRNRYLLKLVQRNVHRRRKRFL